MITDVAVVTAPIGMAETWIAAIIAVVIISVIIISVIVIIVTVIAIVVITRRAKEET